MNDELKFKNCNITPLSSMYLAYLSMDNSIRKLINEAIKFDESMKELKITADKVDMEYYGEMNQLSSYTFETLNNQPSLADQITSLKSQLKHCKNPLQKLNLEREMNRLIREKNRR